MGLRDWVMRTLFVTPDRYGPAPAHLESVNAALRRMRDPLPEASRGIRLPVKPRQARFNMVEAEVDDGEEAAIAMADILVARYKCEVKVWWQEPHGEVGHVDRKPEVNKRTKAV